MQMTGSMDVIILASSPLYLSSTHLDHFQAIQFFLKSGLNLKVKKGGGISIPENGYTTKKNIF